MAHKMAGAIPHDPTLPKGGFNESIRVAPALKSFAGSCNACTNGRYNLDDQNQPLVTEVHLRGLSFRLCAHCHEILKGKL